MIASERQTGIAEGIDQPAESADEAPYLKQLLEGLELGLTEALGLLAQNERNAAMMAVNAVLQFVVSIPGWERRNLGGPLWQLLTALNDLDSGRVGSMLAPNPAVRNRKPDAGMRKIVKAYALFFIDVLCRSEWSVIEGCTIVAQSLQENGISLGGRIDSPSWKSVKGWRDRFTKLAEKPIALIADAIMDCTRRDELVVDPFAGSGSTLIAAHQTGRRARLIEYDPAYCDQILARFQKVTGKEPRLAATGQTFETVAEGRARDLAVDSVVREAHDSPAKKTICRRLPGRLRQAPAPCPIPPGRIRQSTRSSTRRLRRTGRQVGVEGDLSLDRGAGGRSDNCSPDRPSRDPSTWSDRAQGQWACLTGLSRNGASHRAKRRNAGRRQGGERTSNAHFDE
jgi:DNA methylase